MRYTLAPTSYFNGISREARKAGFSVVARHAFDDDRLCRYEIEGESVRTLGYVRHTVFFLEIPEKAFFVMLKYGEWFRRRSRLPMAARWSASIAYRYHAQHYYHRDQIRGFLEAEAGKSRSFYQVTPEMSLVQRRERPESEPNDVLSLIGGAASLCLPYLADRFDMLVLDLPQGEIPHSLRDEFWSSMPKGVLGKIARSRMCIIHDGGIQF